MLPGDKQKWCIFSLKANPQQQCQWQSIPTALRKQSCNTADCRKCQLCRDEVEVGIPPSHSLGKTELNIFTDKGQLWPAVHTRKCQVWLALWITVHFDPLVTYTGISMDRVQHKVFQYAQNHSVVFQDGYENDKKSYWGTCKLKQILAWCDAVEEHERC